MRYMRIAFACLAGLAGLSCANGNKPVKQQEDTFKYLVDEFADIKIIRYRIPGWEGSHAATKIFYLL